MGKEGVHTVSSAPGGPRGFVNGMFEVGLNEIPF